MLELNNNNKTLHLRNTSFRDVDPAKLDAESSKLLISERVLTRGTIEEFRQLIVSYEKGLSISKQGTQNNKQF